MYNLFFLFLLNKLIKFLIMAHINEPRADGSARLVQQELAEILGISLNHLNSILLDKQPLTNDLARLLSKAFGTSPQYWLNIDNDYRLWLEQGGDDNSN